MRRLGAAAAALAAIGLSSTRASAQVPPAAPDKLALGDWLLAPTAEIRVRGEYHHAPVDVGGAAQGGLIDDTLAGLERTRLGLGAEHGVIRAQITLQDAHAWGAEPPSALIPSSSSSSSSQGQFGAYEAYFELHTKDARPSFVRVGRQAVTWGEGRLISAADWSPTGRSLDAIRGRLSKGAWDVEVLGAVLEAQVPLGVEFSSTSGPQSGGSELAGAQVAWTLDPLFKVEATGVTRFTQRGDLPATEGSPRFEQALNSGQTYVASLRVAGDGHGWRYGVEGAYELGRATSMGCTTTGIVPLPLGTATCSTESRAAFAGAAHVSHTFDTLLLTPTLRVGGAYASGDDGSTSTYKQFDPLLPDVHTWHGAMDVFAWSNEIEGNARITVAPWTDATLSAEYRFAALARATGDWLNSYLGEVGTSSSNTSTELGHEIDGVFTWRPWPVFGVVAGYSALLLGDGARAILADPSVGRGRLQPDGTFDPAHVSHLAYLQATLTIP